MPYLDWTACPFECCTYREWGVTKATVVWKERRKGPVAFHLRPGDRVIGLNGVVETRKPGRVRILKDIELDDEHPVKLRPGDVVYALHYLGEGYELFWFNGQTHSDQIGPFEVDKEEPSSEATLWVESLPETVWWVKVKNAEGLAGWTMVDHNFDPYDMDACSGK
jgi:hypothetical protein